MGSILKALGLTVWGIVAIGLLAIFMFVGYEAAIKYRAPSGALVNEKTTNHLSESGQLGPPDDSAHNPPYSSVPTSPSVATRKLMLDAVHDGKFKSAIAYGQQLADEKSAGPGDLFIVAQSYASVGDCENARLWAQRSQDSFQAAGVVADGSLRRVTSCCGSGRQYYELAIASIERGLKKGNVAHLDEAYVYLGLAKQALGDITGARSAFSKLKDVPGISPKVLRLWTLYAETQLANLDNWDCANVGRASHDSSSTGTEQLPGTGR